MTALPVENDLMQASQNIGLPIEREYRMAHEEIDALLNAVLPLAQQMLGKYGEFYPIGASISATGEVGLVGVMPESEHPEAQEIIDLLMAQLVHDAGTHEIRGSVICFDGTAVSPGQSDKSDAICAHLEHESGICVAAFLPYRKEISGQVTYGELFAGQLKPQIFVSGTPS